MLWVVLEMNTTTVQGSEVLSEVHDAMGLSHYLELPEVCESGAQSEDYRTWYRAYTVFRIIRECHTRYKKQISSTETS